MNHDRKHCKEKLFRGKNVCKGFYCMVTSRWFGIEDRLYTVCPCSCHEGVSEADTLKAIQEDRLALNTK